MPDAPGRGLSHTSQASAPDTLSYVQLGQDHTPAAQKSCSSATLQTHRTMQTTVTWDRARAPLSDSMASGCGRGHRPHRSEVPAGRLPGHARRGDSYEAQAGGRRVYRHHPRGRRCLADRHADLRKPSVTGRALAAASQVHNARHRAAGAAALGPPVEAKEETRAVALSPSLSSESSLSSSVVLSMCRFLSSGRLSGRATALGRATRLALALPVSAKPLGSATAGNAAPRGP